MDSIKQSRGGLDYGGGALINNIKNKEVNTKPTINTDQIRRDFAPMPGGLMYNKLKSGNLLKGGPSSPNGGWKS